MGMIWPDTKHQLCFWHAVRALKQHLCKNKETPAPYNTATTNREFPFIDVSFIPAGQCAAAGTNLVCTLFLIYCSANLLPGAFTSRVPTPSCPPPG